MRYGLFLLCAVSIACFGSGCTNDAKPEPFAQLRWLMRCDAMHGCTGYTERSMFEYNGEDHRVISCSSEARGSDFALFFSAFNGTDPTSSDTYGLELRSLIYSGTTGAIHVSGGAACAVRVHEGGNDFSGGCGPNPPTASQACQFTNMAISGSEVTGELLCQNLAQTTAPTILREVTGPDSSTMTVQFSFKNCGGL